MRIVAPLRRPVLIGVSLLIAFVIAGSAGLAQPKGDKPNGDDAVVQPGQIGVLETNDGIRISAALQMMAVPNPTVVVANRIAAVSSPETGPRLFPEWDLVPDGPLPLSDRLLGMLRDDTPIPNKATPVPELTQSERAYWAIQDEALFACKVVPPELFKKAAEKNEYVTFDHLFENPNRWRGEVVPVVGKLLRVRKWRPSQKAQDLGIDFVYEGFVAGQTPHRPPYWILFTKLPEGLKVQETMSQPITFYGYFIKRVRYQAENVERRTNLLIGPTVYLQEKAAPPPPSTPFSREVLFATFGGLLALATVIVTIHWWFHRGDRKIHSRLAALRDKQPLGLEGDEPAGPQASSSLGSPDPRDGA
jgi:hypothetical protein